MANPVIVPDALFTDGGVNSSADARLALAAGWAKTGPGIGVRTGVVWVGQPNLILATATTSPSMTVQVVPLNWIGRKTSTEGCYVGALNATFPVDVAAAPGSNSRIDVVYVMQRDANAGTSPDSLTQGELGVITGTPAVTPAKPAIPAGAVEVGTVQVGAGATKTTDAQVTITTTCQWTAPVGASLPVRNQAERDALTQYDGLLVNRLDLDGLERSDGTTWKPIAGAANTLLGSAIAGISVPATLASIPGVSFKTGLVHSTTTVSFGNEYAPAVTYDTPFPNGTLAVVITQIHKGAVVAAATYAHDQLSATGFRTLYPGGTTVTERAFVWLAIGY